MSHTCNGHDFPVLTASHTSTASLVTRCPVPNVNGDETVLSHKEKTSTMVQSRKKVGGGVLVGGNGAKSVHGRLKVEVERGES